MPEPSLTPEEKLLRIIESGPGKTHKAGRVSHPRTSVKFTIQDLKNQYLGKLKKFFNLKAFNITLIFLGAGFSLFVIVDFLAGLPRMSDIMRLETDAKTQGIGDIKVEHLKSAAYYLQEITAANIFNLPRSQPVSNEAQPEPLPQELTNLVENLNLVGIIWSKVPQAIIEDRSSGKTFLVNRGSKVKIARVKEILKDKVILSYDNQEVELK